MTVAQSQKALTKIRSKGREVRFIKLDRTVDDSSKPWRGTSDPRATPLADVPVSIVAVPPTGVGNLGFSTDAVELLKRSQQILIAATGPDSTDNLEEFDEVIDGSTTWTITTVQHLRHDNGPRILYYVGVRQ